MTRRQKRGRGEAQGSTTASRALTQRPPVVSLLIKPVPCLVVPLACTQTTHEMLDNNPKPNYRNVTLFVVQNKSPRL